MLSPIPNLTWTSVGVLSASLSVYLLYLCGMALFLAVCGVPRRDIARWALRQAGRQRVLDLLATALGRTEHRTTVRLASTTSGRIGGRDSARLLASLSDLLAIIRLGGSTQGVAHDEPDGAYRQLCLRVLRSLVPDPAAVSRNIEDRMHQSNKVPDRCARCTPHRGYETGDPEICVGRADDHAQWYWELYKKAVDDARLSRRRVDEAEVRVDEARDRAVGAYRSRDHSVRLLRKIRDLHTAKPRGCECGKRPDCDTAKIVDGGWVHARIRDLERQEAKERQRARRFEWDDYKDDVAS